MTPILRELKAVKIIAAMVSGRIKGPKARKGPAFLETASGAVCLEGGEGDQSGRGGRGQIAEEPNLSLQGPPNMLQGFVLQGGREFGNKQAC